MQSGANEFESTLSRALGSLSVSISPAQLGLLRAHFEAVVEANRIMNLTRITHPSEAAVKHYADSLALLTWPALRGSTIRTVLDVGTGAGFPAVPIAVMRTDWEVTAVDSTRKKVQFLERIATELGLTNLGAEHAHTDHWQPGRPFDLVVVRAVARLARALKTSSRLASPGGWIVAYKTAVLEAQELDEAATELKRLNLRPRYPHQYELQAGDETLLRALYGYRKSR